MTQCVRFVKVNKNQQTRHRRVEGQEHCSKELVRLAARPRRTVETTSTVKKEAHHELNAVRKRLNDIATAFAGCNALETFTSDAFTRVDYNDH